MEGIYGGEILLKVFWIMLVVNGATRAFLPCLKSKENEKSNENVLSNTREISLWKSIIQSVTAISIFALLMYLIIKYPSKILMAIVALFMIMGFVLSLLECIKFIFFTPSKFKVTKESENSLWLAGIFVYSACKIFSESNINIDDVYMKAITIDFVKMTCLTIWYFSVIFFSSIFLILSIHNLVAKFHKGTQIVDKVKKENFQEWTVKWNSEKIWDSAKKEKRNYKKILLHGSWLIFWLIDIIKAYFMSGVNIVYMMFAVIVALIIRLKKGIDYLLNRIGENQDKTVVICARLALVISLIIVYVIDNYKHIFTEGGSNVYMFLCSVIIIPMTITQITTLKRTGY